MYSKKVKLRLFFFLTIISLISIIFLLIFKSLEENVIYFLSPTDIYNKANISFNKKIRVGGLVKENSIIKEQKYLRFIITDLKNEIIVSYEGLVPNLFSEGKGVIAEGTLKDKKYLIANKILAKHDENYMPPEVKNALDASNE